MLEMGDAKSTSLAESQCAKGSAKAVNSADHKIYFYPTLCGLGDMRQSETTFSFSNFETKQKPGIFTREIGKSGYF